ncbi:ThuA domain-containing protein [Mucisphaera calidilacus]|uniref:Uncharacterized protein n=1 Tax=Mucisphaera calidilacus TaxID=2527982 RepID=A0A518BTW2_9BACT|nr:ThuA domain-containing protein [Mucisphaera calidilacus]QDU70413.1 hypothetical protein Pan265_02400 [Mucisphaera calidilacus]
MPSRCLTLLLLLLCLNTTASAQPETSHVLYLYGNVDEDGNNPAVTGKPPFHPMRLDDTHDQRRGMSQFRQAIEDHNAPLMRKAGVRFRTEERLDTQVVLTPAFLGRYDVLILASNNRRFTTETDTGNQGTSEAQAVADWIQGGGGLIVWSDSAFGGHFRKVGLGNTPGRTSDNDIITQFGMFMMRDNGAGNYLINTYEQPHYLNDFDAGGHQSPDGPDAGVHYRGEGVSVIRVSEPAVMLARLQHGGLGGKLRLNHLDTQDPDIGPYQPDRDAALAIAEIGQGRVLATFDRNTFWNAGEGTRLAHADNREFAQRILIWTAGYDTLPKP